MTIDSGTINFECYCGNAVYELDIPDIQQSVCQNLPFYAEFEGNAYCVLHHPSHEKEQDFNLIFQERLTKEDYDFRGVVFPGKLNLKNYKFNKKIDFTYAIFTDEVDFSSAIFSEPILFQATQFWAKVSFFSTTFLNEANFNSAEFGKKVDFWKAIFGEDSQTSFHSSRFQEDVNFFSANIKGYINFEGAYMNRYFKNGESDSYLNLCFGNDTYLNLEKARIEHPDRISFQTVLLHPGWFLNVDPRKFVLTDIHWENADGSRKALQAEIEHIKKRQGVKLQNPLVLLAKVYSQLAANAEKDSRNEDAEKFRQMATEAERLEKINKAPSQILSVEDRIWLEAIYEKIIKDEKIDSRTLRIELRDKLSPDFTPRIPGGFLRGDRITLLGIYLIDPESEIIRNADKIIQSVQGLIEKNPRIERIRAEDISKITGVEKEDVENVLEALTWLGMFRAKGESNGSGGYSSIIIGEEAFADYRRYGSIKQAFESFVANINYNSKQKSTIEIAETNMSTQKDCKTVFVVHGRNELARKALFSFLRSIGLHPLEWSEAVKRTGKASPYVGEVLDVAFSDAQAIVVLFTPDDLAMLAEPYRSPDDNDNDNETKLTPQARANVIFEAGMAMGRNPDRTILVELGKMRPFSDIGGRHTIRLNNSVASRQNLAQRLETAGCSVNLAGTDWHDEGKFEVPRFNKT